MMVTKSIFLAIWVFKVVNCIPASCSIDVRFPYVFGFEDIREPPSFSTKVLNMVVVPTVGDVGVVAAVWSESKAYFYGGTDHGTADGYHGVIWMKEDDHAFKFKTGFTKNHEALADLEPVILVLDSTESHIAVAYADISNNFKSIPNKIRFAFRLLDAASGEIQKSMALDPTHLNSYEFSRVQNTMSVYKGDYLFFIVRVFDSSLQMGFFRIDMSLPSGSNHLHRLFMNQNSVQVMKYITWSSASDQKDYFVAGGSGYMLDDSDDPGYAARLYFFDTTVSSSFDAQDNQIVSIYQDATIDNFFSYLTTFDIVGLVTRTRSDTGHIQFIIQSQCNLDYGHFTATCPASNKYSLQVRHFTIDFTSTDPHYTFATTTNPAIYRTSENIIVLDGAFLGDAAPFTDYDAVWLLKNYNFEKLQIIRSSLISSSIELGFTLPQAFSLNADDTWNSYMQPIVNMNLHYISKRQDVWGNDDLILFLGANSVLYQTETTYKIIPANSHSIHTLTMSAPQGIVLAMKETNDITCIDAQVPDVVGASLEANGLTSTNYLGMLTHYQSAATTSSGATNFMTTSTSLWEDEGATDHQTIPVAERVVSFSKTADDSSFCQFVDTDLNSQDPLFDAATRTFTRLYTTLVEFTGTFHEFITTNQTSAGVAYLSLEKLMCTSGCSTFEANTCGNPLLLNQIIEQTGLSNFKYPSETALISATHISTLGFLEKIEPEASATSADLLGFHIADIEHSYSASSLSSLTFPSAYQSMKLGIEITEETWDRQCITPSDFSLIEIQEPNAFSSFDKIPLFFVAEQTQTYTVSMVPLHKYPFSCQVSDFQVLIKKADGSWVELFDSISGSPAHSDQQDQKMSAMMGFTKTFTAPTDATHNDLAWLVNLLKVEVSFQAMVEPSGAYAGLSVADFKALFTEPADKYISNSSPWNSTNQQFFRMASFKVRPYVGSTLVATEEIFNLYFIFCGEDLTVSAENLADVKSTSYLAPNKITFDSRYDKYILKVDLTSSTTKNFQFSNHQFCTQAQCGAEYDVCQPSTKHPFPHSYQVKQSVSSVYQPAPTPITLTSNSFNPQTLDVTKDIAFSFDTYGPIEDVVIQLINNLRGGATVDTIQFDVWVCTQEWFSSSPLVVPYTETAKATIGEQLTSTIAISGLPTIVTQAQLTKFLQVDTGHPTIAATLEKTSTSLNPPLFTLTVETSDPQFGGKSVDLAFDFITCLGKNLTISVPVYFSATIEAEVAYLGQRTFFDLATYGFGSTITSKTEVMEAETSDSLCLDYLKSQPLSLRQLEQNGVIQVSLKVDLAEAPIACEGATMSVRIDLEVNSVSEVPLFKEIRLECLFDNSLCVSPEFDSPAEEEDEPAVEDSPVQEDTSPVEEEAAPPTEEEEEAQVPIDLEKGVLSLVIGGQVFVYDPVSPDPEPQPPTYQMQSIDSFGRSSLEFDQPMMHPLDLAKIDYSRVFRFEVVSVLDGSSYVGQWVPSVSTSKNRRQLAVDQIAPSDLTFTWQVTCWETSSICFQFDFLTPANVSSSAFGRDTLKGTILDTSYFMSASTNLKVDAEKVEPIGGPIRPQGLSAKMAEQIEELVGTVSSAGNTAGTSNLLVFYVLGASKQKLWSLMNAIQTIIYSTMADVNLPAPAAFFFQQVLEFAKMDVFSTEEVFAEVGLMETEPLSPQFEEAGFETKSFLINQGSFLVFLVLGVIEYFGRIVLMKVCIHLAHIKIFRMIGIRVDDPTLWATLFRLVMQTYIDIFICVALQAIQVYETGWASQFESPQDSFNTVLALVTTLVILVFPAYSFLWLKTNRENLSEEDEHGNYWPLYENVRLQSLGPALYHILFIARRICLVSLLIFSSGVNVFQAIGFLTLSAANLAYLIGWKPFFNPDQNRQEVINETAVYLASHTMFALLNSATTQDFRSYMSWLLVGICILSIVYNLFFVIRDLLAMIISEGREAFKRQETNRNRREQLQSMSEQIKALEEEKASESDSSLSDLKRERDLLEQRLLHQEWSQHREWCKKHRIDLSGWEVEQRYLKNGETLGFFALLAQEKRLAIERENAQASSHSQKFVDIMKQIKQASARQSKLNQRIQWLLEVEREGQMTERLISRGCYLGLYKSASEYGFDPEARVLIFGQPLASGVSIPEEEINLIIVQEQLRLLRESGITDWSNPYRGHDKDVSLEIEFLLNKVFRNPLAIDPQRLGAATTNCSAKNDDPQFIPSKTAKVGQIRGRKITAMETPRKDALSSSAVSLNRSFASMTFDDNAFSFRAQSTCLKSNQEEAARKTSSQFGESVSPSKSISLANNTGSSFMAPPKKSPRKKPAKPKGVYHQAPWLKKKKKKKKAAAMSIEQDAFYPDYF